MSKGSAPLQGNQSLVIIHDPSSICKPESKEMENSSRVLDLNKQVVNGYETFNSVAIGEDKRLHLLGSLVHEEGTEGFLSRSN